MMQKCAAALSALALAGATIGMAQVSIGGGGQWLSISSSDYDNLDFNLKSGFGLTGSVMFPVGRSLRLGASGQWSSHGVSLGGLDAPNNFSLYGLFGEAQYAFRSGGQVTPYVGLRAGYARWSYSEGGQDLVTTGFGLGGGGGILVDLSPRLALDLNGMLNWHSNGDIKVDGTAAPGTDAKATVIQIRAGIVFLLGGSQ